MSRHMTSREIAAATDTGRSTVNRLLRLYKQTGRRNDIETTTLILPISLFGSVARTTNKQNAMCAREPNCSIDLHLAVSYLNWCITTGNR